jgi:hypothetical protein
LLDTPRDAEDIQSQDANVAAGRAQQAHQHPAASCSCRPRLVPAVPIRRREE